MINHNHRHQFVLVLNVVIFLTLSVAIGLVGVRAYGDFVDTLAAKKELALNQSKTNDLFALRQIVKNTADKNSILTSLVVTPETLTPTIELLEKTGRQSGATTTVVDVGVLGALGQTKINGWKLEVRLEGSFEQVLLSIKRLEVLPVMLEIAGLKLVRLTPLDLAGPTRFAANLTINLPTVK